MISFENARILSYNHQNTFWGDNFNYGVRKELRVNGSIYNLTNSSGVSGVWKGISGMEQSADDYHDILIGGVNYGKGRVDSLTFENGNDVRKKNYSASITIFETGNLFNLTGEFYSGINIDSGHLLENFTEDYDFSLSQEGKYSYRHNITSRFISGGDFNPIQLSKELASGLFSTFPIFGLTQVFESGILSQNGRRLYSESYNLITNECSFSEFVDFDSNSGFYSFRYSHEIVTDENGITTVSENGTIEGIEKEYYNAAESGYLIEINNSFNRLSNLFAAHTDGNFYPLVNQYLNLKKTINTFEGKIDYSISYSNNPNNKNTYIWEYTNQIDKLPDSCFYNIQENGKIKGVYPCTFDIGSPTEEDAWNNEIRPNILNRISGFYNSATKLNNPIKIISSSKKKSPYNHEIEYNFSYTDDLRYSESGFRKIDVNITDQLPIHLVNKFNVINVKELVQPANITKESNRTISISMIGERGRLLQDYLNKSISILNLNIPNGSDTFVNSCKYSLVPNENKFDLELSWTYFGDREFNNILL